MKGIWDASVSYKSSSPGIPGFEMNPNFTLLLSAPQKSLIPKCCMDSVAFYLQQFLLVNISGRCRSLPCALATPDLVEKVLISERPRRNEPKPSVSALRGNEWLWNYTGNFCSTAWADTLRASGKTGCTKERLGHVGSFCRVSDILIMVPFFWDTL